MTWLADRSPWLLTLAAPLLLFPRGYWPWLGVGLVLVSWLVRIWAGKKAVYTGLEPALLLLAGMAALGWAIAIAPELSVPRFWSLILGLMVFVECSQISLTPLKIRVFAAGLSLATLGVAAITLIGGNWDSARLVDPAGFYKHMPHLIHGLPGSGVEAFDLINLRWLGITLGFLIPVPLAVLIWGKERRQRILASVSAFVALFMLVLTQSLQGLLGLTAGIFFLLIWRWRWLLGVGLAGLLAGGILLWSLRQTPWLQSALTLDTFAGLGINLRLDIWSRAWAMLKDMPLSGIGLNNFPTQIKNFYPGFVIGSEPHAHQLFLQTALDLGLPGLFAFLWVLILWFQSLQVNFRQTEDRLARALYLGLAAGVFAYLAHGLLDALMLGAKPGLFLWIMLGLGVARLPGHRAGDLLASTSQRRLVWVSFEPYFALILGLAYLVLIRPSILEMNIATLEAHRILIQPADISLLENRKSINTIDTLRRVAALGPENRTASELAGRLLLRQADPQTAIQCFYQVVNLDRLNPYKQFYPPAYLSARFQGHEPSYEENLLDLALIYNHWIERTPSQASYYLLEAILYDKFLGQPEQARQVLERGVAQPAYPPGALEYYRDKWSP